MERDKPELVAFLQESDPQVYKDICIDAQIHSLAEKCELDHHNNVSYILNYELYKDSMEAPERVLFVTTKAESFPEPEPDCTVDVVRQCNSVKLDGGEPEGFVDSNSCKEDSSERQKQKQKQKQIQESETESIFVVAARSINEKSYGFDTHSKSNVETRSSKVDTMNTTDPTETNADSEQPCKSKNISNKVAASSTVTRHGQNAVNLSDHDESGFPLAIPTTDHFAFPGPLQRSDSISFRSTSSATSGRSFAFPVLTNEWSGSPARMDGAHNARSKKQKRWKTCFCW